MVSEKAPRCSSCALEIRKGPKLLVFPRLLSDEGFYKVSELAKPDLTMSSSVIGGKTLCWIPGLPWTETGISAARRSLAVLGLRNCEAVCGQCVGAWFLTNLAKSSGRVGRKKEVSLMVPGIGGVPFEINMQALLRSTVLAAQSKKKGQELTSRGTTAWGRMGESVCSLISDSIKQVQDEARERMVGHLKLLGKIGSLPKSAKDVLWDLWQKAQRHAVPETRKPGRPSNPFRFEFAKEVFAQLRKQDPKISAERIAELLWLDNPSVLGVPSEVALRKLLSRGRADPRKPRSSGTT